MCLSGHIEYVEINSSTRKVEGKIATTRCFSVRVTDRILAERQRKVRHHTLSTLFILA
jgi:hypothetical protein